MKKMQFAIFDIALSTTRPSRATHKALKLTLMNQRESMRFSENSLNFSQYSTIDEIQWFYIH